jgi:hypothetical protein
MFIFNNTTNPNNNNKEDAKKAEGYKSDEACSSSNKQESKKANGNEASSHEKPIKKSFNDKNVTKSASYDKHSLNHEDNKSLNEEDNNSKEYPSSNKASFNKEKSNDLHANTKEVMQGGNKINQSSINEPEYSFDKSNGATKNNANGFAKQEQGIESGVITSSKANKDSFKNSTNNSKPL